MKKFLFICMIAIVFAFIFIGCGRNNMQQESPNRTTTRPERTQTQRPVQSPTQNPTQTVENIEPTDPSVKDDIEGVIESIVPDMESMLPNATQTPKGRMERKIALDNKREWDDTASTRFVLNEVVEKTAEYSGV